MDVKLLAHTPEPIRVLWTAARTCYSPRTPQELWDDFPYTQACTVHDECMANKAVNLLRSLWERGHRSVFEHVSLTYAVSGVSRVLLAQYSRHRIGVSLSVQSQRRVQIRTNGLVPVVATPPMLDNESEFHGRRYIEFIAAVERAYQAYERLLELGVPKEDARFILPEGTVTNFVTTVNLRSLMHIYRLRVLEPGAQWEIRNMVREMGRLAVEAIPKLEQIIPGVRQDG